MKKLETFEVGTQVIVKTNSRAYMSKIVKETKTQFTCEGGVRFMKSTGSMVGSDIYYFTYAYAVDDEGLERVEDRKRIVLKDKKISYIRGSNLRDLSLEQLSDVVILLDSFKGE